MKTIFKSMFAAVLFMGIANIASAQLGTTASIDVTARVLKQITIASSDVQFGAVPAGNIAYIDPTGAASSNVGFTSTAGRIRVDATPDEPIRVEFDSTLYLSCALCTNNDSLSYVPYVTITHGDVALGDAAQATSIPLHNITLTGTPNLNVTENGGNGNGPFGLFTTEVGNERATMFLGGYLYAVNNFGQPIPTAQATGTYEATMIYNFLYAD
ncbi:MAG: hypothetical protein ACK417_07835 [Bacteroidia bacterium]